MAVKWLTLYFSPHLYMDSEIFPLVPKPSSFMLHQSGHSCGFHLTLMRHNNRYVVFRWWQKTVGCSLGSKNVMSYCLISCPLRKLMTAGGNTHGFVVIYLLHNEMH